MRAATLDDAAAIAAIYAPIVTHTTISFEIEPPSADEIAHRMTAAADRWPWLVAGNKPILGYAYASEHRTRAAYRWSVDVSVYVAADARRLGVGRRLYVALLGVLSAQGYYNAFAGITLPNDASTGFHRALGFAPVGVYRNVGYKHGAWRDVAWFARPLLPAMTEAVHEPVLLSTLGDRFTAILEAAR